jgi:hypothetical protein
MPYSRRRTLPLPILLQPINREKDEYVDNIRVDYRGAQSTKKEDINISMRLEKLSRSLRSETKK